MVYLNKVFFYKVKNMKKFRLTILSVICALTFVLGLFTVQKNVSLASILSDSDEETARITVITDKCLEKSIKEVISELDNCEIASFIRVMEN